MPSQQCLGTTKRGTRCLITVRNGNMCHHHVGQTAQWTDNKSSTKAPGTTKTTKVYTKTTSKNSTNTAVKPAVSGSPERKKLLPPSPSKGLPAPRSPAKITHTKPGYIYIYTLESILESESGNWLKTRNLPDAKDKKKWVAFDSRKYLLVKVGMTTQTVAKRLLQWENQCSHKLVCLNPDYRVNTERSLVERMKLLALKPTAQVRQYTTFQQDSNGFFVPQNVMQAEREIHSILRQKYGRGDVQCTGCVDRAKRQESAKTAPGNSTAEAGSSSKKDSGLKSITNGLVQLFKKKDFLQGNYNIHVEWFAVPRDKVHEVYTVIDEVCVRYLP